MDKRIIFGWDLIRHAIKGSMIAGWEKGIEQLQQALAPNQFYAEFNSKHNELLLVRKDSFVTVTGYPESFYKELEERYHITKTVQ